MYVTVERAASPLSRVVWRFWVTIEGSRVQIRLDTMEDASRPSPRHRKWVPSSCWYRLNPGRHCPGHLKDAPTPPEDVVADAVDRVVATIEFVPAPMHGSRR